MFIIYKITNSTNQKCYIGITHNSVHKRWIQHKSLAKTSKTPYKFYQAIRKYGTECWTQHELYFTNDENHASNMEEHFIIEYDSFNNGYNSTKGGLGSGLYAQRPKWTAERRQRVSEKMKGRVSHPGRSGVLNPQFGKPGTMTGKIHSSEIKQKNER